MSLLRTVSGPDMPSTVLSKDTPVSPYVNLFTLRQLSRKWEDNCKYPQKHATLIPTFYRSHPKDGEDSIHGCLATGVGGRGPTFLSKVPSQPLVPRPFSGVPHSLVPGSFSASGTPVPVRGYPRTGPRPSFAWGNPPPTWLGLGYPWDWLRCGRYASCSSPQEYFL